MRVSAWALVATVALSTQPASGSDLLLRGKVVMEDGSPPGRSVSIERWCDEHSGVVETVTNRKGEFTWHVSTESLSIHSLGTGVGSMQGLCYLKAVLSGYESNTINLTDPNWFANRDLPTLVLEGRGGNPNVAVFADTGVPFRASNSWSRAVKAMQAKDWAEAERFLRAAVQSVPRFAQGWNALGLMCMNQRKTADAREAYRHAIDIDPKLLPSYLLLARANNAAKEWEGTVEIADALIKADAKHRYPEIYLQKAVGQYQLKNLDGAEASIKEAMRLDLKTQMARSEYVLGLILAAKRDYTGAGEHMRKYLDLEPKAENAPSLRSWMEGLGKQPTAETAIELPPIDTTSLDFGADGEAWVPGGMKALAALAHSTGAPSYRNFFLDYCRALARETSVSENQSYLYFTAFLQAYIAAVAELSGLGQRRGDATALTMSMAAGDQRKKTARILSLLGWKIVERDGVARVEPGDQAADGFRQPTPALLGIDEIDMQEALESGRNYTFEIPSENARIIGDDAWKQLLKEMPAFPGGLAEAFTRDLRLARTYAGLGAMGADTAAAVVSSVGLRTLVTRYSEVLAFHGEAFALSNGQVVIPGGAEAAWKKLAGASPKDPRAFFRAVLEKERGKLASFYFALWRADAAHQSFFTRTPAVAERFYAWYNSSDELRIGPSRRFETWRTAIFRNLPLDAAGHVRFPGGRQAWTTSTVADGPEAEGNVLVQLDAAGLLEPLVPVARLEDRRHASLDDVSARLLAQHYTEWRSLFPYFERLPGLGRAEFQAFAAFTDAVGSQPPDKRQAVLGEWHSLVELIARGTSAGTLDAERSARAFRSVCDALKTSGHSTKVLAILREIAGGSADLDEAVPNRLLRLSGERRASFDRVKQLQSAPRISALHGQDDAAKTAAALSGVIYAASLDPEGLLINEDPQLLKKHRFFAAPPKNQQPALFTPATLNSSSDSTGSYFSGGFTNFEEVARTLAFGGKVREPAALAHVVPAESTLGPAEPTGTAYTPADVVFRANGRLVEVYATITDQHGRYADDLPRDGFQILDRGEGQNIVAFESQFSDVSCVLLLDTTGSMQAALPALKDAALKLIGDLRPADSVAVYSFNDSVTELQPFTTDKNAAKRAVLRTHAYGNTALYDALTRVNRDLSGRSGKKVIVVFTDGDDNASTLTTETAIQRAKAAGVPVYTIAQGEALTHPAFLKQLAGISKATGGVSFAIREAKEIRAVFDRVSQDLTHGYLFAFQPAPASDHAWHSIEVLVKSKNLKVRAREGYYPE